MLNVGLAGSFGTVADAGVAILFSSHQLDLVEDICEDVVIINKGKVVLAGDVEQLRLSSPRRHLDLAVDGQRCSGLPDGNGLVSADIDLVSMVEKARADGEITRLVFEPPGLDELFHEAVSS